MSVSALSSLRMRERLVTLYGAYHLARRVFPLYCSVYICKRLTRVFLLSILYQDEREDHRARFLRIVRPTGLNTSMVECGIGPPNHCLGVCGCGGGCCSFPNHRDFFPSIKLRTLLHAQTALTWSQRKARDCVLDRCYKLYNILR